MTVTSIVITLGSPADQATGLLAFVSCTYGGIEIDGLAIRRTTDGRIIVTFPAKSRNRCGRRYFVTPRSAPVRLEFETAILAEFRRACP